MHYTTTHDGAKRFAPSAERTQHDILEVLREILPPSGIVLEIASGTGQHAAYFAAQLPQLTWQPSDVDSVAIDSIERWQQDAGLPNLLPPVRLDVTSLPWPVERADAVLCINMIHISPWRACEGLMGGAGRLLPPGGVLILYGAYFIDGRPTAPSNQQFDSYLRAQNPAWGVRNLTDVTAEASCHNLELQKIVDMPGNNFIVVYRKSRSSS